MLDAAGALFAWRDQPNPHRSAVHRRGSERDGDLNEERCDNHSWLCVDGWRHDGGGGDVR